MTSRKAAQSRDAKGRFKPGISGNPLGRMPDRPVLPALTFPTRERIMLAASRPVQRIGDCAEGDAVTLFEACVEVMGFVRNGNRKSAADFVRTVQWAAASVRPREPQPQLPSHETSMAILTYGSDEEFEELLATQQAFFERLVAEMTDGELSRSIGAFARARRKRSS